MINNPPAFPNTMFSRRRSGRRRTSASAAPDWVWGAGFGLIIVLFIGGYFLVSQVSGGSVGSCDKALPPLGSSTVNQETFVQEEAGLTRVLDLLARGDRAGAEAAFFGPIHNFTHNVDPSLREADEPLAKRLCAQVLDIENGLTERAPNEELIVILGQIREILRDAAEALGYSRPG